MVRPTMQMKEESKAFRRRQNQKRLAQLGGFLPCHHCEFEFKSAAMIRVHGLLLNLPFHKQVEEVEKIVKKNTGDVFWVLSEVDRIHRDNIRYFSRGGWDCIPLMIESMQVQRAWYAGAKRAVCGEVRIRDPKF